MISQAWNTVKHDRRKRPYHQQVPYCFWQPSPQAKTSLPHLPSERQHCLVPEPLQVCWVLEPHLPSLDTLGVGDEDGRTTVVKLVRDATELVGEGLLMYEELITAEEDRPEGTPAAEEEEEEEERDTVTEEDGGAEIKAEDELTEEPQVPKAELHPVPQWSSEEPQ
ncbi:hypothetical protein BDV95DRAFT_199276 [Massariosphaeria phaeospora]|uniref:Uncharacterized protein n=1 Tax=Massariosphaeria phaeospora TaxID=100035 RepID=A0A7C8MDP1_9PLEO|nr:hypothetical protein BDV95DRAFT_199276 [Massariosphaeria phaeospora]